MGADDPKIVSSNSELEQQSLRATEDALAPWRLSRIDQRNDFGHDAFVNIVNESDGVQNSMSPLSFWVQCKSHGRPFGDAFGDSFFTRDLGLWSRPGAGCTILMEWSQKTGEIRWRSAKQVVAELDSSRKGWREQEKAKVHFRPHDVFERGNIGRSRLRRHVDDECDLAGGIETFHLAKRRIVLTHLSVKGDTNSQTVTLESPSGGTTWLHVGPHWAGDDVDWADVDAGYVLTMALLLFEVIWLPFSYIGTAAIALSPDAFCRLLRAGRIIPFLRSTDTAFMRDNNKGSIVNFEWPDPDARIKERVARASRGLRRIVSPSELLSHTRTDDFVSGEILLSEINEDLRDTHLRGYLGLRQQGIILDPPPKGGSFGPWESPFDGPMINRLIAVNEARFVGKAVRADAVFYEAGLSKIASLKDYSLLHFNRDYPTADAFDAVLRAAKCPDVGLLARHPGAPACAEISESPAAQDFRNWFWEAGNSLLNEGSDIRTEFATRLAKLFKTDVRAMDLPNILKFRFITSIANGFSITAAPAPGDQGYALRSERATETLKLQVLNHAKRRRQQMLQAHGGLCDSVVCPCGTGIEFGQCCGRLPA